MCSESCRRGLIQALERKAPKLDLSTILDEYIYFPEQILTMCCPRIRSAGKILIKSISAMIEAQKSVISELVSKLPTCGGWPAWSAVVLSRRLTVGSWPFLKTLKIQENNISQFFSFFDFVHIYQNIRVLEYCVFTNSAY